MSMIPPPPPPIPGTFAQPQTAAVPNQAAVPPPPVQVSAAPAAPPLNLPPDMPVPGTVPIAQATGEIPTQIPMSVPPSPPPVVMPPAAPQVQPQVAQEVPEIQAPPAPPAATAMPQMPPAPVQQVYQPAQAPALAAQEVVPAQPQGMMAVPAIDYDRMPVAEIAEAMGIKGVDFTAYGTTPTIALNQGAFKTNDGTINLGTEFVCRIHETRPKYLYVTRLADSDPNHATAYSYDQQTSNGKSLKEILYGWAQRGLAWDLKNYLEATCMLEDGRVVMLSIPFTSMSRFAGFAQSVILSRRHLSDVVCKVGIGPLVTKAVRPFNPISFEEVK
jgi:hypothetical protein